MCVIAQKDDDKILRIHLKGVSHNLPKTSWLQLLRLKSAFFFSYVSKLYLDMLFLTISFHYCHRHILLA